MAARERLYVSLSKERTKYRDTAREKVISPFQKREQNTHTAIEKATRATCQKGNNKQQRRSSGKSR
jgi:hypothetical protein